MGQKVHPYGFRVGFTKPWRSRWFAKQGYAKLLQEDMEIKEDLKKRLKSAGVSSIEVDRPGNKLRVTIRTSRPGIIIGRKGAEIEKLKGDLAKSTKREVFIDIQEVHKPELDAQLVSESVALQLEKRVAFRRAMRKAVDSALRFGCKGIKVRVSGRLNGAEIARSEWYLQGQLPLHTIRADIDYGFTEAHTTYGVIGIKAWVYKGEIIEGKRRSLTGDPEPRRERQERQDRPDRDRRPRRDDGRPGGDSRPPRDLRPDANRGGVMESPSPLAGQSDLAGAPTQAAPGDLARPARSGGALMPPLTNPPQSAPTWKQEPEVHQAEAQQGSTAPETSATPPASGHADPQANAPEDKTGHGGEE
jgi:small subunit ribosomal protein S3